MSRIPGSFLSDDDDDDVDLSALADLEADEMMTEPSDEDDADFVPGADEDSDGGEMESTSEDGNDDDAEDAADPGPNLQIAYDGQWRTPRSRSGGGPSGGEAADILFLSENSADPHRRCTGQPVSLGAEAPRWLERHHGRLAPNARSPIRPG